MDRLTKIEFLRFTHGLKVHVDQVPTFSFANLSKNDVHSPQTSPVDVTIPVPCVTLNIVQFIEDKEEVTFFIFKEPPRQYR